MKKEGWSWLINAIKWHYFVDGRSLCGKWLAYNSDLDPHRKADLPDNCKPCQKALLKLRGTKEL
jgi:hypothetical protein